MNAALLKNGKVLLYYKPTTTNGYSQAKLYNPSSGTITDVSPTFPDDILCSGFSIDAAGKVLVTGGMDDSNSGGGIVDFHIFDPDSSMWSPSTTPHMQNPRFYPTNVQMPDGTTLVLSGDDDASSPRLVLPLESWNGTTWSTLPNGDNLPGTVNAFTTYPRMKLLPDGTLFEAGIPASTSIFNPVQPPPPTGAWSPRGTMNFGPRYNGGVVQLPGSGSSTLWQIFTAGGNNQGGGQGTITNSAESIDLSSSGSNWTYTTQCMCHARYNLNLVMLADSTILAVGGGNGSQKYSGPVKDAELFTPGNNPVNGTWNVLASQMDQRTYHSTAILLADGRVLSAGSDANMGRVGTDDNKIEIFKPPYLFDSNNNPVLRPQITTSPTSITYAQQFSVNYNTPNGTTITGAALIRPGATTHANDMEQRYVNLSIVSNNGSQLQLQSPPSSNYAPPGYYMLVILNSSGVPSPSPVPLIQLQ